MRKLITSQAFFPILAVVTLWLKTVVVSFLGFNLPIHSWIDVLLIIFNPLGSLMLLLGLSFFFFKKMNGYVLILIMLLLTGLLYGDLLYYRFYIDFVTVSILFQFKNVGGIGPSTFELMKIWDLFLFIDIVIFLLLVKKQKLVKKPISVRYKKMFASCAIFFIAAVIGIGFLQSQSNKTFYSRTQMVKELGPYTYHLYDIVLSFRPPISRAMADQSDTAVIKDFVSNKNEETTDLFGIAKGKNVVLISMESTQDFVINQKIDGKEITPFLNDLIKESYYFSHIYDQTAQGKTSDSEIMVDTGLYPLSGGSVFVRRPENTFISMQKLLKEENYYSAVFHGNDPSFWNRENMYKNLGYERFFSKGDYTVTPENSINYGIKDIPFFQQSIPYLKSLPKPYLAKFITLTNHFPFLLNEEDQMINLADTDEGVVNRYVTTVRYQDEAIKQFFQQLNKKGMYKDTIFILYGDHYGISEKYEDALTDMLDREKRAVDHTEYRQVPLIIHIPGQKGMTISSPGGEVDIQLTLLHLLGIKDKAITFGYDLFTRPKNHPVIFRDGGFVTEKYIYQDNTCYHKGSGEQTNAEACMPFQETVSKELNLSDDIINGDLLRFNY